MHPSDSKVLGERLQELAEVFNAKPVSEKGLSVWFNVLREFPTERVCGILIGWPKFHAKFPVPAEVWKVANDSGIGERERKAEQEKKSEIFHPGVGGAQAEKFIAEIRALLKQPTWTPKQHWQRNMKRFKPRQIGYEFAKEALEMKKVLDQPSLDREPGQDEEERAA